MTTGARVLWFVSVAVLVGCAAASSAQEGQQDASSNPHHDAHTSLIDSPKQIDAGVNPDGALPIDAPALPADAADEPLICQNNAQCTTAGDCCFTLGQADGFCVPGTIFLGACLPN